MAKLFDLDKPLLNPSLDSHQDVMLELFTVIYSSEGSALSIRNLIVIEGLVTLTAQVCHEYIFWLSSYTFAVMIGSHALIMASNHSAIHYPAANATLISSSIQESLAFYRFIHYLALAFSGKELSFAFYSLAYFYDWLRLDQLSVSRCPRASI